VRPEPHSRRTLLRHRETDDEHRPLWFVVDDPNPPPVPVYECLDEIVATGVRAELAYLSSLVIEPPD
jgi:hypothetical protein